MAGDLFVGGALKFFVCIAAFEGGEVDFDVGGVDLVPAVYYDALAEGEEKGGVSILVKKPILLAKDSGIRNDGVGSAVGFHDLLGKGGDKEISARKGEGIQDHGAVSGLATTVEEDAVFFVKTKNEMHEGLLSLKCLSLLKVFHRF